MPDPKKNSSIFSFSKSQLQLLGRAALFFVPVIAIFLVVESLIVKLPSRFKIIGEQLEQNGEQVKVAVFGSSQIMQGVNPEHLTDYGLNFSSGAQHHNTDFNLLKGLKQRLPNLETVVFEVSFSHFEIPHNSKHFPKNSTFLKFYKVNTFGHKVYIKDQLLFPSRPEHFSQRLIEYFVKDSLPYRYNQFGYDTNLFKGKFKRLNFDTDSIIKTKVHINNRAGLEILEGNSQYFEDMIRFAYDNNWNVAIVSPPTFENYNELRDAKILKRRDSILASLATKYPSIKFLNCEEDTSFLTTDFNNENHLNPRGAQRFTNKIDSVLQTFK